MTNSLDLSLQPKQNQRLLQLFYDLGDGGQIDINNLKIKLPDDENLNDRLRYLHARVFIKNVAMQQVAIDKPGIVFILSGGFEKEFRSERAKKSVDTRAIYWKPIAVLIFISGLISGILVNQSPTLLKIFQSHQKSIPMQSVDKIR